MRPAARCRPGRLCCFGFVLPRRTAKRTGGAGSSVKPSRQQQLALPVWRYSNEGRPPSVPGRIQADRPCCRIGLTPFFRGLNTVALPLLHPRTLRSDSPALPYFRMLLLLLLLFFRGRKSSRGDRPAARPARSNHVRGNKGARGALRRAVGRAALHCILHEFEQSDKAASSGRCVRAIKSDVSSKPPQLPWHIV